MAITLGDPNSEVIRKLLPNYRGLGTITATGTFLGAVKVVRIPLPASSTGNYWINPETGTVLVEAIVVWTTSGTGTFDLGVSTDGTSGTDDIINGGSLLAGAYSNGTVAYTLLTGVPNNRFVLCYAGGSGTKNSVTCIRDEALTSTAAGYMIIRYMNLQ